MLNEYEKAVARLVADTNQLEVIECQDAATGNRVVAIVLVDLQGSLVQPIATLFPEDQNLYASLIPRNDARFNAARWEQSQLTDGQFLRQMGIDPSNLGNGNYSG